MNQVAQPAQTQIDLTGNLSADLREVLRAINRDRSISLQEKQLRMQRCHKTLLHQHGMATPGFESPIEPLTFSAPGS